MRQRRRPVVAVIGAAVCTTEQAALAEEVGRLLAERGAVLVCGGRGGVMEAACRGAQQAGGLTVGILPGLHVEEGNPYLSLSLPTGLGQGRNAVVVLSGRAVIAIGGGFGTLSEIGMALKHGRSVIGLGTWEARHPDGGPVEIVMARTPEQAVDLALNAEEPGASV
jgi:hypothetical protein